MSEILLLAVVIFVSGTAGLLFAVACEIMLLKAMRKMFPEPDYRGGGPITGVML